MEQIKHLQVKNGFEEHLSSNDRVFFSGIYGIGKTTFLKEFFKKNSDKYNAIHLFPVNYSVAENRDIFELIKSDILFALLDLLEPSKLTENQSIYKSSLAGYISENFNDILLTLLKNATPLGKKVFDVIKDLDKLKTNYKSFIKENENLELSKILDDYYEKFRQELGGIYEENAITELIQGLIQTLSFDEGKKNVLIIDDLDRLDPAHIFRLLNVLSAHDNWSETMSNKFGFDKVIVVADYDNIHGIFSHFYGKKAHFEGYIDKFYNGNRYELSFEKSIEAQLHTKLNEITIEYSFPIHSITILLTVLFESKRLNFRQFKRISNTKERSQLHPIEKLHLTVLDIYDYEIERLNEDLDSITELHFKIFMRSRQNLQYYFSTLIAVLVRIKSPIYIQLDDGKIEINILSDKFEFQNKGYNGYDDNYLIDDVHKLQFGHYIELLKMTYRELALFRRLKAF